MAQDMGAHTSGRRKLWSALVAALLALAGLFSGIAGNIVAAHIDPKLRQYTWVAWAVFGVCSVIAVWAAVSRASRTHRDIAEHSGSRSVISAGHVDGSVINTGDHNSLTVRAKRLK
jgi:membrane protein implicated in regulation of membrane protease activity